MNKQRGFTVIELIISIVLVFGLVIAALVIVFLVKLIGAM